MCYLCSGSQTLRPIYLLTAILVEYFGAILLLDGIVKNGTQIKLQQPNILFALHPEKQSLLGINYCLLVGRNDIYISAKN